MSSSSPHNELSSAILSAVQTGPALDRLIHRHVLGADARDGDPVPPYSSSWEAAGRVLDHLAKEERMILACTAAGWYAKVVLMDSSFDTTPPSASGPEAVCRAALVYHINTPYPVPRLPEAPKHSHVVLSSVQIKSLLRYGSITIQKRQDFLAPEKVNLISMHEEGYATLNIGDEVVRSVSSPMRPGQLMWVKERWTRRLDIDQNKNRERAKHYVRYYADNPTLADEWHDYGSGWRSAASMPCWASRFVVEVTSANLIQQRGVWEWRIVLNRKVN